MWRRHGCRRKPAHETENNLFIKGWDAGVEESFAVGLWIVSGGCWAGCHSPPLLRVHGGSQF